MAEHEMFLTPELARTTLPFLSGVTGAPSWAGQVQVQSKPQ